MEDVPVSVERTVVSRELSVVIIVNRGLSMAIIVNSRLSTAIIVNRVLINNFTTKCSNV